MISLNTIEAIIKSLLYLVMEVLPGSKVGKYI